MFSAEVDSDASLMSVSFPDDGDSEFMSVADESIPEREDPLPSAIGRPPFLDQYSLARLDAEDYSLTPFSAEDRHASLRPLPLRGGEVQRERRRVATEMEEYWADEAERLLRSYRRAHEDIHGQLARRRIRRVDEELEVAFQRSLSLTVWMMPRIRPWSIWVCRLLGWFRGSPAQPTLRGPLATGFVSKLIVDLLMYWGPSLLGGQQRFRQEDLPEPFTSEHLEICVVGTCLGVALGHVSMQAKSLMPRLRLTPVMLALAIAPTSARFLSDLYIEAQTRDSSLSVTIAHRAHRLWKEAAYATARFCRVPLHALVAAIGGARSGPGAGFAAAKAELADALEANAELDSDIEIPSDLLCPITRQLFVRPVLLQGAPFEEDALRAWLDRNPRHPLYTDVPAFAWQIQGGAEELRDLCQKFAMWANGGV